MDPVASAPTRIAALAARLLGTQTDVAGAHTAHLVATATERLAERLVDWHDAVVQGRPSTSAPAQPAVLRALPLASQEPVDLDVGRLGALALEAQVAAGELALVARTVHQIADQVAAGTGSGADLPAVAHQGRVIADQAARLSDSLRRLAALAAEHRQRLGAQDPDSPHYAEAADRARGALARCEQSVQHCAATTLRG